MPSARIPERRAGLAAPLLLALALLALAPTAAHAAVAALEKTQAVSASNSSAKGASTTCPSGKRVLGSAGRIVEGAGEVVLDDLTPNSALTGVQAFGAEDGSGYFGLWQQVAEAICATPPIGLQLVTATSPTNSSSKGVTATCPSGKRVVGTGADLTGGLGQVVLDDIAPNAGLTAVTAFGVEDGNGHSGSWSIRAHAICATAPAGLQRVATTSASSSVGKTQTATCPAGKDLMGLGSELTGGAGQVVVDEFVPTTRTLVTGANAQVNASEDENGQAANWTLTAYAICANGSQRTSERSAVGSEGRQARSVCPGGMFPTGGGGEIDGGFGQVTLWSFNPRESPVSEFIADAQEDGTGTSANWSLVAHAICATPLPGWQLAVGTNDGDTASKTVTATCPAGTRVVGAGARVSSASAGQVLLESIAPNAALSAVTAAAREDPDGAGVDWDLQAAGICANPPPGLQRVSASSIFESGDVASVTAACPAGKNLLGIGHGMAGAGGRVALDDLRPNALLTSNTVAGIETEFGNPTDWNLTAYAICANP